MITQGKHASTKLYKNEIRIFKTYKDSVYVDNEYFALSFLAKNNIMDLHPKKESPFTISMDWIKDAESIDVNENHFIPIRLAAYLKVLHKSSFEQYGLYITHEDLFSDNILICPKFNTLYFIDWGLSKKRNTIYPDIASVALGIFNEKPEYYRIFLDNYFNIAQIDYEQINFFLENLFNECIIIREKNNFETESLEKRLICAKQMIKNVGLYAE